MFHFYILYKIKMILEFSLKRFVLRYHNMLEDLEICTSINVIILPVDRDQRPPSVWEEPSPTGR